MFLYIMDNFNIEDKKEIFIKEAIEFGWITTKNNLAFFIGLLIVWKLLVWVPHIVMLIVMDINPIMGWILFFADLALTLLLTMGLVKISLNFCDNKKGEFSDLLSQYRLLPKFLLAFILFLLIISVGFILLIIPGIFLIIKLWFWDYFIIDKKMGPIEALKKSWNITNGHMLRLFLFFAIMIGINILGAFALLVGLFITFPVTMVATAFVYRKLLAQTELPQTSKILPEEMVKTF